MTAIIANTHAESSGLETLITERQRMQAANYTRAYTAIAIVDAVMTVGHIRTALRIGVNQEYSWTALRHAAGFARDIAPEHRQQLQGLLAILAIATAEHDPRFVQHFAPAHLVQLAQLRSRLTPQEESWAREQLRDAGTAQLSMFPASAAH